MAGALAGIRIIEFAGLGPGPFAAMMLADHGAEVIRVERPGLLSNAVLDRSRRSISIDLKSPDGREIARDLVDSADGLIEGYRPGAMERLGLGPEELMKLNPSLVYGRMTGWGQEGPFSALVGHDINYIAVSGALHAIGDRAGPPVIPLNLIGDFGGGGMLLAFGMVSALLHARTTGEGQVVDCAMTDGAGLLLGGIRAMLGDNLWLDARGANILDGGAPFYSVYQTACGGYVSIGSIEPDFYRELLCALDLEDDPLFQKQMDRASWPAMKERLASIFIGRTRDAWCEHLQDRALCFAPVLSLEEAPLHPQNHERSAYLDLAGVKHPAPAPRFSASSAGAPKPASAPGANTAQILSDLGYHKDRITKLFAQGAVHGAQQDAMASTISLPSVSN